MISPHGKGCDPLFCKSRKHILQACSYNMKVASSGSGEDRNNKQQEAHRPYHLSKQEAHDPHRSPEKTVHT